MRTDRDTQLVSTLKEARKQHPCYGVRGLRETVDSAIRPSYGKCYRLCKENGLLQRKKRPHGLTKCNHRDPQSGDLVQRDFTARKLGVKYLRQHRRTRKRKGPAGRFHPAGHIYAIPSALQPH